MYSFVGGKGRWTAACATSVLWLPLSWILSPLSRLAKCAALSTTIQQHCSASTCRPSPSAVCLSDFCCLLLPVPRPVTSPLLCTHPPHPNTIKYKDLALLDRGVVLAICHARGGGELGSHWHTSAKKLHKKRTFQDLLACAHHLALAGYTRPSRLGLWGRSAGGLTLGASLNMHPGVAAAAVLDVPFLDVLGDMSDPSLPLTIKERGEWGDPLANKVGAGVAVCACAGGTSVWSDECCYKSTPRLVSALLWW